ncbi:MAG: RsmE family RNA methyltransferase [Spirochaetales bacterium]|nr:RsmE family RNA methyltransferase [Spirochaetales bacterium]
MNLLLFREDEWKSPLSHDDPRVIHIHTILKSAEGDVLDAGIIGGMLGRARILEIDERGNCRFDFIPDRESHPPAPLTLIIGTPRPPTAKRLLRDLSAAGAGRIIFTGTDLGEKSYLTSRLWSREEWKEAVETGMAQGESTRPPVIEKFYSLYKSIDQLSGEEDLLALDNVNPDFPLKEYCPGKNSCCLALGPERGWSDREREILRDRGFRICSLGDRVLRTETAAHMGSALVLAALGYI